MTWDFGPVYQKSLFSGLFYKTKIHIFIFWLMMVEELKRFGDIAFIKGSQWGKCSDQREKLYESKNLGHSHDLHIWSCEEWIFTLTPGLTCPQGSERNWNLMHKNVPRQTSISLSQHAWYVHLKKSLKFRQPWRWCKIDKLTMTHQHTSKR